MVTIRDVARQSGVSVASRFSGGENMANVTKSAATKRNNRKIHARKFLATPEGKAWQTLLTFITACIYKTQKLQSF